MYDVNLFIDTVSIEVNMTWIPKIDPSEQLRYRAIAASVREAMRSGELQPGDHLPTHRALAERLGVTPGTVARAYALAGEWGLVSARVGAGTVVLGPEGRKATQPLVIGQPDNRIDFGLLFPAALTDLSLQERCFGRPFSVLGRDLLRKSFSGYSPELGQMSHRTIGAAWLTGAGIDASPAEVFISDGGQSAFLILFSALARSGASILVEELPYLGIKHLCATMNINLVTVPTDREGMVPEKLRERANSSGAQIVLLTPALQNPTGARMTQHRREQIVHVARELNLSIIEDAAFDRLYPGTPSALATLAPERTYHVASFSKMASPAMRVAFVKVPGDRMQLFESVRHSLNISGPSLEAEVVCQWIQAGLADELCQWQRTEIDRRWQTAAAVIPELVNVDAMPAPFAWAPLPDAWRASDFAGNLRHFNVTVIEAYHFAVGRAPAPHAVRIALTSPPSNEAFEQGLTAIRSVLDAGPRPAPVNFR
ncbi:aminotransferase-like domain-containing protein [Variovorax boronicumulans]